MKKIVTSLPIENLWNDTGIVVAKRSRDLYEIDIRKLLGNGPISFVVASLGQELNWIAKEDNFDFWKNEVIPHLANSDKINLDGFENGYCYSASEWKVSDGTILILLEMFH